MIGQALARCQKKISVCSRLSACGKELRLEDDDSFRKFLHMEPAMFDEFLHIIRPSLAEQNTWYQQAIGPGLRITAVQCVQDI